MILASHLALTDDVRSVSAGKATERLGGGRCRSSGRGPRWGVPGSRGLKCFLSARLSDVPPPPPPVCLLQTGSPRQSVRRSQMGTSRHIVSDTARSHPTPFSES
ncbi:hypothetical protein AAFF_G00270840 [Aldrovandia affinis]|uniref:Uncharacterized protein n=1 Tax=Aldrovandia affinis TaxID=143900 RepID=A0AAD7RB69_9TELE|nr:hypothetical protein AAFF_G00270840 [Aldrovandia affinis]